MTPDKRLAEALAFSGDPVRMGVYTGPAARYYVYSRTVYPTDFADDEPQAERWFFSMALYAPLGEDIEAQTRQTALALRRAGFSPPTVYSLDDADGRQRNFEFEWIEDAPEAGDTSSVTADAATPSPQGEG